MQLLRVNKLKPVHRKPCVIANWKMHGSRQMLEIWLKQYVSGLPEENPVEVVLCPPAVYLSEARLYLNQLAKKGRIQLGAQNSYAEMTGAFTGEISPSMIREMGCHYVLAGHSERRQIFSEDDTLIARKVWAAYHADLTPIICVGETTEERNQGKTLEVICRQLAAVLPEEQLRLDPRVMVAYEPVWAIGTGLTATPLQAEEVHVAIREWLAARNRKVANEARLLYGGSVKPGNVKALLMQPNIDGVLVGSASLNAQEFLSICMACRQ